MEITDSYFFVLTDELGIRKKLLELKRWTGGWELQISLYIQFPYINISLLLFCNIQNQIILEWEKPSLSNNRACKFYTYDNQRLTKLSEHAWNCSVLKKQDQEDYFIPTAVILWSIMLWDFQVSHHINSSGRVFYSVLKGVYFIGMKLCFSEANQWKKMFYLTN